MTYNRVMETPYHIAPREKDGLPCLVTAAFLPDALRARLPFLLRCELAYEARPNGLPAGDELNRLCELEDKIVRHFEPAGAVHLGHITFAGRFTIGLASPVAGPPFIEVRTGLLRKERVVIETAGDPLWQWFAANMKLTPVEIEDNNNRPLLAKLGELGDVAEAVRPVDFTFYFKTERDRAECIRQLEPKGFLPTENGQWLSQEGAFGLELARMTTVEPKVIAELCAQVRQLAEFLGGEFDGWACPIQAGR